MSDSPQRQQGNGQTEDFRPPMSSNELAEQATRPPDNIMLHGYREQTEEQQKQLREFKDSALQMWNDLHAIDGSSAEQRYFEHRELEHAAVKLEEMMLWIEKFYAI